MRQKCISSTAPMAKFATTMALARLPSNGSVRAATSSSDSPLVPMTAWIPLLRVVGHVVPHGFGDGEVDHDLGTRGRTAR